MEARRRGGRSEKQFLQDQLLREGMPSVERQAEKPQGRQTVASLIKPKLPAPFPESISILWSSSSSMQLVLVKIFSNLSNSMIQTDAAKEGWQQGFLKKY